MVKFIARFEDQEKEIEDGVANPNYGEEFIVEIEAKNEVEAAYKVATKYASQEVNFLGIDRLQLLFRVEERTFEDQRNRPFPPKETNFLFHVADSGKDAWHVITRQWHIANTYLSMNKMSEISFDEFLMTVQDMADCQGNGGTFADLVIDFDENVKWADPENKPNKPNKPTRRRRSIGDVN